MAMVTPQLLLALRTGFKQEFENAKSAAPSDWNKVATLVTSTAAGNTYGWLGQYPKLREWVGKRVVKDMAAHGYLRLMTPLGTWWADTHLGSRLHELEREKDVPRVRRLAVQYSEQALQPLINDGRARSVSVAASMPHNGRCDLRIEVEDNTGHTQTFSHHVRVG